MWALHLQRSDCVQVHEAEILEMYQLTQKRWETVIQTCAKTQAERATLHQQLKLLNETMNTRSKLLAETTNKETELLRGETAKRTEHRKLQRARDREDRERRLVEEKEEYKRNQRRLEHLKQEILSISHHTENQHQG